MRWPSYRLPTWLLVICVGAAIIGFMDGILTWIVNELNEVFARAGLAEPHPDAWTWIITSLLVGVAGREGAAQDTHALESIETVLTDLVGVG
jgi:hypothetical protein